MAVRFETFLNPQNERINISIQDSRVISICYRKPIEDTQNAIIFTISDHTSSRPMKMTQTKSQTNKISTREKRPL